MINVSSCNAINDPYAKLCVPNVVENVNVKVFNLISRTNETRHIKWHETCKCKCRLDACVCNNVGIVVSVNLNVKNWLTKEYVIKDLLNHDKLCDVGEYLDYKNCKCRKKLVDKLV